MFDKKLLESIKESVLCWLATVNHDGEPNVSPKELFMPLGDRHLLIANIASPVSVNNISGNSNVCVSFVEVFKQKGHKLKGKAKVIDENDMDYPEKDDLFRQHGGDRFPIKAIIEIEVTAVSEIIAPSYWLFPHETTEITQIEQSLQTYGVKKI